jgi:hypothetical protein
MSIRFSSIIILSIDFEKISELKVLKADIKELKRSSKSQFSINK